MKELSIEEKARAYDEALETARKINSGEGVAAPPDWTICEVIFPELKESEEEKIRKAIYIYLDWLEGRNKDYQPKGDYSIRDMLAWLEKQGEKDKINITFEDVLALECSMKTAKITKGGDELYKILVPLYNKIHNAYLLEKQGEQKSKWDDKNSKVNDETNAPTEYGKYVDECLNDASKHFFSEGEDKYSVADLFYAGVRCGKSWLEKQGEKKQDPCEHCNDKCLNCHNFPCVDKREFERGKSALEAIKEEKENNYYET